MVASEQVKRGPGGRQVSSRGAGSFSACLLCGGSSKGPGDRSPHPSAAPHSGLFINSVNRRLLGTSWCQAAFRALGELQYLREGTPSRHLHSGGGTSHRTRSSRIDPGVCRKIGAEREKEREDLGLLPAEGDGEGRAETRRTGGRHPRGDLGVQTLQTLTQVGTAGLVNLSIRPLREPLQSERGASRRSGGRGRGIVGSPWPCTHRWAWGPSSGRSLPASDGN